MCLLNNECAIAVFLVSNQDYRQKKDPLKIGGFKIELMEKKKQTTSPILGVLCNSAGWMLAESFLFSLDKLRRIIRTKKRLASVCENYPEIGFLCEVRIFSLCFLTLCEILLEGALLAILYQTV
ncbi:hypothetical protein VIBR0546_14842 [Vibrio brasiliensis LMG 20546]|uniref:Uncharacterized protein n=1 Tax=Vibrio brasiliensis LMG 20546 TaxID=945543 RepID=E8LRA8_9VIBR|nr:hypothetical protein VIBR0546_14842 [Vibrio brasiliensis LMG 20546]